MVYRNITDIKPNPKNPRVIKDDKYHKLVESLRSFPQMLEKRPLVCFTDVDKKLVVLGGNMRLKAAIELGMNKLPVELADDWTEEQRAEFLIKDNVGFGEWNWEELQADWDVEQLGEWGLDIPDAFKVVPDATEDDYEIPDEIETDIMLGDLFEIGEHRLLCGDSTDSDAVGRLMDGQKAELMFTSPPYNAGTFQTGGNKVARVKAPKKYQDNDDSMSIEDYTIFIKSIIDNWLLFCDEVFLNIGILATNKKSISQILFDYSDLHKDNIYWVKTTSTPQGLHSGIMTLLVEPIFCFGLNGSRKFKNAQFKGTVGNVIQGSNNTSNEFSDSHNAGFPVYLPSDIITKFTNTGSTVTDCFMGTGTTMVAAHQLNRKCYGMELDPKYCQVIIDRMRKLDPDIVIKKNGVTLTVT